MNIEQVKTLEALASYIKEYKSGIYVREQVNGKWGSYSLTELPADKAIDHALSFIERGFIPTRIS